MDRQHANETVDFLDNWMVALEAGAGENPVRDPGRWGDQESTTRTDLADRSLPAVQVPTIPEPMLPAKVVMSTLGLKYESELPTLSNGVRAFCQCARCRELRDDAGKEQEEQWALQEMQGRYGLSHVETL